MDITSADRPSLLPVFVNTLHIIFVSLANSAGKELNIHIHTKTFFNLQGPGMLCCVTDADTAPVFKSIIT